MASAEAFVVRVNTVAGYGEIVLTKALLEELVAVAPVTWSSTAAGIATISNGATQNAYFFPVGQNRGFYIGRSNEDPLKLLWAFSHDGATNGAVALEMQFMTLAAGSGGAPHSEQEDASISTCSTEHQELSINVPGSTWGFVNFGKFDTFTSGEWYNFLVADLQGLTETVDGTTEAAQANSLMFYADEESYFYLGHTSGDKVTFACSTSMNTPDRVRIRQQ